MVAPYGLVSLQGAIWKTHRKLISPAFSPSRLRKSVNSINGIMDALLAKWDKVEGDINIYE